MSLELEQVRVTLTKDPEILSMLRTRKQLKKDKDGEYYPIVFNSAELRFRPNRPMVVGKSVAESLVRSSYVILGEDLTGDMTPVIESLDGYNLNKFIEERSSCEYCSEDFPTARALSHHLIREHRELLEKEGDQKPTVQQAAAQPAQAEAESEEE